MGVNVMGLGTAVPPLSLPQDACAAMAAPLCCRTERQTRLFVELCRRSQIQSRYSVLLQPSDDHSNGKPHGPWQDFFAPARDADDLGPTTAQRMQRYADTATTLARQAAEAAMKQANITPEQVAHLLTVSCTGFAAPGVDVALIRQLHLPATVTRSHIGFMGCHGAFNAMRLGASLAQSSGGIVLICAVELCSLHFAYGWNSQRLVANALFADGAGAVVLRPDDNETDRLWQLQDQGSVVLADSEEAMTWTIRDHGFEMTLSPQVPDLIDAHLEPWLSGWLARRGLSVREIGSWAVHPGGPRILAAVGEALHLPSAALAASQGVLADYGNMSSPTVLFILERLQRHRADGPCVALGFGPGLTIEAMLLV